MKAVRVVRMVGISLLLGIVAPAWCFGNDTLGGTGHHGVFSAEDYRAMKRAREDGEVEERRLIRTRDGVLAIRKRETPNGSQYIIHDMRKEGVQSPQVIIVED